MKPPGLVPAFTLLELLIVCAVGAILLTYAVPAYQAYVQRVYRGLAIEALLASAACQERYFARAYSYNTQRCLPLPDGQRYDFSFVPEDTASAATFVVQATPMDSQAQDICGTLGLDHSGMRTISGPAGNLRKCWEGR
jgi:type IV pilus assembly protein PilE